MFKQIVSWFFGIFRNFDGNKEGENSVSKFLPPIHFDTINIVDKPPKNIDIKSGHLYCVLTSQKMKWLLFECPCGCGDIVTLSLQTIHRPFWKIAKMDSGRTTLHPSVWRDKGCFSHFWIRDGRVFWCTDTGQPPTQ